MSPFEKKKKNIETKAKLFEETTKIPLLKTYDISIVILVCVFFAFVVVVVVDCFFFLLFVCYFVLISNHETIYTSLHFLHRKTIHLSVADPILI